MTEEYRSLIVLEGRKLAASVGVTKAVENNPYSSGSDESEAYISGCMLWQEESNNRIAVVVDVAIGVIVAVVTVLTLIFRG